MKIKKKFSKICEKFCQEFNKLQEKKISPVIFLGSFSFIIGLRIFIEFFLVLQKIKPEELLIEYLHNWLFFLILSIFIWFLLSFILKINPKKLTFFVMLSFWLIILPPIFDIIQTKGSVYWSFYALVDFQSLFRHFATFFGELPSGIRYFGSKIGFILAMLFTGGTVFILSRSYFKALISIFFTYIIIFILGIFPSFLTFIYYFFEGSKKVSEVKDFHAIQLFNRTEKVFGLEFNNLKYSLAHNLDIIYFILVIFLAIGLFCWLSRVKFIDFLKNLRFPQLFCHFGLLFMGMSVGFWAYPESLNLSIFSYFVIISLILSIFLAWEASVIFNDLSDFEIDLISNKERPLPMGSFNAKEYRDFGLILLFLSLIGGLVVGVKFALILLLYQIIGWFYSAPPFRIKKIPVLATFVSSFALILIFFMGFILFSGENNLLGLSWRIIILLFAVFTFSLPLKDFKDIEGDREKGVWTIPVIFGERIAKLIVASGIFLSFMFSVFLLNEFNLFWWALIFGSSTFLLVVNKEIKNTKILWWILGLVFCYGLILVKTIFLN